MRAAGLSSVTSVPESSVTVMGPAAAADGELEAVGVGSPSRRRSGRRRPAARTATRRSAAVRRPKRVVVMAVVTPFVTFG